ncbi:sigma 54-interacting transcriptional regulator, partial [Klebsiella pneumoniae]
HLATLIYQYAIERGAIAADKPFVELNCADYANNPELLSATLFGYTRGAFTGADREKRGAFDDADGGFLFLDEVHRLSAENQEKLFLFMDKGYFYRL